MSYQVIPPGATPLDVKQGMNAATQRALAKAAELAKAEQEQELKPQATQEQPKVEQTLAKEPESEQNQLDTSEQASEPKQLDNIVSESEAPAPEAPKAPENQLPLSAQYAQLARKEKALRAKALELKQKEDALKASLAPKPETPSFDPAKYISREELAKNPWKYAQEAGLTYEELTKRQLDGPSYEMEQQSQLIGKLQAKIDELEGKFTNTEKSLQQQQQDSYKQAVETIRQDVTRLVKSDPAFETVKTTGSINDVVELVERTFKEGLNDDYPKGSIIPIEVAAQMVEDEITEQLYNYSTKIEKIKKRFNAAPAPAESAAKKLEQTKQPQKTLSNSMTAAKPMTQRERALAAAKYGPDWRTKVGT